MNWSESIKAFKSYLILERGLSENTLENYIFDIQKLVEYLPLDYEFITPYLKNSIHLNQGSQVSFIQRNL